MLSPVETTVEALRTTEIEVATRADPPVAPGHTEDDPRTAALAAISDNPVVQSFYDRVVPGGIVPAAWMPFWPSAWSEAE